MKKFRVSLLSVVLLLSVVDINCEEKITPRVIDGKFAKPHQFPYQVALKSTVLPDGELFSWCGASLISKEFVLTAAHCIYSTRYEKLENGSIFMHDDKLGWVYYITVIIGAHHLKKAEEEGQQIFEVHVSSAKIHPQYKPYVYVNDIALIKLPQPVVLNDKVQIISLPPKSMPSLVGKTLIASGWGLTNVTTGESSDVLRYTRTKVYNFEFCEKEGMCNRHTNEDFICAYNSNGIATCTGDSGGPNVLETDNGKKILVGISSFHSYKGCSLSPSGLTRVSNYLDWIAQETGIAIEN